MNQLMKTALKEALTESVTEIVRGINSGEFETIDVLCACGKQEHQADAIFCNNCGKKLERTAVNDSL